VQWVLACLIALVGHDGWDTARADGLSLAYPAAWHRAHASLTPFLTDPKERFAVATFPLRRGPVGRCAQAPVAALRAMRARDVLITVQERARPHGFPARTPGLGPRTHTEFAACARRHDLEEHWVQFADHGRGFLIHVAIGPQAPPLRRVAAARVLDSLRVRG
jgi:hypothetical protein